MIDLWESSIWSQISIRSVRSARSTNSFYPFTLSTLPPSSSASLPISRSYVSADRYPLKIPDCTDNTLQSHGMQIPSEKKTETHWQKPNQQQSPVTVKGFQALIPLIILPLQILFFSFLFLSQKLKLSSKPVWEWRYLCGDGRVVHLRLQRRLGRSHVHPE